MIIAFTGVVYLVAILIATAQDLYRREVDNWLNYGLLVFGVVSFLFIGLFAFDLVFIRNGFVMVGVGFLMQYLLYYGRVFAGGDAKLLFALSPYFVSGVLSSSLFSFVVFILLLFLCGGVYGLVYSLVLYGKNFNKSNHAIYKVLQELRFVYVVIFAALFILLGLLYSVLFMVAGLFILCFPLLIAFSRGLEKAVMVKQIKTSQLRAGDWLAHDVKVGTKTVHANFEGVSERDIRLLKKKRFVTIKEGLPFVPAFLFAFIIYHLVDVTELARLLFTLFV